VADQAADLAETQLAPRSTNLTVYSRQCCHLCDDLIAALTQFLAAEGGKRAFDVVDVDAHPLIEAQWGEKVPVLLADGKEICHYFFDAARLRAHLHPETAG
jgi:thioredoxin-like negative regulator of GroEL